MTLGAETETYSKINTITAMEFEDRRLTTTRRTSATNVQKSPEAAVKDILTGVVQFP